MGCSASKNANDVDVRYDDHGNLVINQSRSGLSRSSNQPGKIDVNTISTEQLLYGSKQIDITKPERLYLLLEKALYQRRRPDGMAIVDIDMLDDLTTERQTLYKAVIEQIVKQEQKTVSNNANNDNAPARFIHPITKQTPLHLACQLIDLDQNCISAKELCRVMDALLRTYPTALLQKDALGHVPLHYAIAPNNTNHDDHVNAKKSTTTNGHIVITNKTTTTSGSSTEEKKEQQQVEEDEIDEIVDDGREDEDWRARGIFVQHLFHSNLMAANDYWQQSDVIYDEDEGLGGGNGNGTRSGKSGNEDKKDKKPQPQLYNDDGTLFINDKYNLTTGGCSPLYRVLQTIPDDFDRSGPTVDYIKVLLQASYCHDEEDVVRHRDKYKYAAGNTWKIIEALLKPPIAQRDVQESLSLSPSSTNSKMQSQSQPPQTDWGIVHRAVQMETPPDLLRYIVETNAQDLTKIDSDGNLPLHYAAMVKPPKDTTTTTTSQSPLPKDTTHFPSFYSKYVVDELLYKFPEAAGMTNANGSFPLTLAVTSGKQWIGGGIKSLYDAYPKALGQIDLKQKNHQNLLQALSMGGVDLDDDEEEGDVNDNDDLEDLLKQVTSNEMNNLDGNDGDGGIIKDEHHDAIMLVQQSNVDFREVAIAMWAHEEDAGVQMLGCCAIVRLLGATASVVNAMKAHPNEMIVQEKACAALQLLAPADGRREVSMVASGAVASVVAAMQAHVGDASVQEEACAAIGAIVKHGGGDRATVVASVSGVTAILNAIAAHPRDVKVQKQGLNALPYFYADSGYIIHLEIQSNKENPDL
ncbi:hypothetical protein FRACYDRAFT_249576 [Fragilariopsis cylindrus CCMP1102]|uniref:ARM repeat-containing protein n=1 Tax=Fragilariopsis cylindrus CCMP1102 TaxID=635003 RepID=A0A1E7ES49_9STRA|nr:hypothetical protein FRACYDRAFT_249576 [Fragilariopsis cylindrus CCMP1102]|eukprot:OEU08675.1 hypothetical protein FRACYDRAFT_249576 [Fragilariopsis cylindrus CCMP1102]